MYMNDNCKILHKGYDNDYKQEFQQYFIQCFYGKSIVMGSQLVQDDQDGK